jgi:radical SAM protein with 4Fe4S-binding SPASM domain
MKKKGLLVSVFTNACLVTEDHVSLFKHYPPRELEVTVYGVTQDTYERVTRSTGSFAAFMRGLSLLFENGIEVRLKTMALRSNLQEIPRIVRFCREKTVDRFRLDPFLHLRYDGDLQRNEEIRSERLSPEEIAIFEASDPERLEALRKSCGGLSPSERLFAGCNHLFHCGAGFESFSLSHEGILRLCSSLWHPDCVYDLRRGNLQEAWQSFIPKVRAMTSDRSEFLEKCRGCSIFDLCMWCPAHAYLETGELDRPVDYFCRTAYARTELIG